MCCVLGKNPVLIHHSPQLQLVIRGQKNLKKRGVSRTHQVSLSLFQALSPVSAEQSGVLRAAWALLSEPSLAAALDIVLASLQLMSCLLWVLAVF